MDDASVKLDTKIDVDIPWIKVGNHYLVKDSGCLVIVMSSSISERLIMLLSPLLAPDDPKSILRELIATHSDVGIKGPIPVFQFVNLFFPNLFRKNQK